MHAEVDGYLRSMRERIATTTYHRKAWIVGAFVKFLERNELHFSNVKQRDVENFLHESTGTFSHKRSLCHTIKELFNFLALHPNPAAEIRFLPNRSRVLPKVPSRASIDAKIAQLSDDGDNLRTRARLLLELTYGSGLRRVELSRLNVEHLDLDAKTVRVQGKGGKFRVVPITTQTVDAVREYRAKLPSRGSLFVAASGKRLSVQSIYYTLRKYAEVRPHLLRHACATHMLEAGCGVRVIGELLGHAKLTSTQVYTHVDKSALAKIVGKFHPRSVSDM